MSRTSHRAEWLQQRESKGLPPSPTTGEEWRQFMGIVRHSRAVSGMTIRQTAREWCVPVGAVHAELERYRDECVKAGRPAPDILHTDPPDLLGPWDERDPEEIAEHAAYALRMDCEAGPLPLEDLAASRIALLVQDWIDHRSMQREPFRIHSDPDAWDTYLAAVMRDRAEHGVSISRMAYDKRLPPPLLFQALEQYRDRLAADGGEPEWLIFEMDPPALLKPWDSRTPEEIREDEEFRIAHQRACWKGDRLPARWQNEPWW